MPTPEQESSDDALVDRLRPQALLARGLEDPASTPPSPTPHPKPAPPASPPSAGSSEDATIAATLAEMFPEFDFEGVISRGGFGTVYRAEHRQMKRRVALKILSSALTRNISAVARFQREIAAIATLDHPGIVRAFDAGQRGGVWFLAMELVDGADFSTVSRTLGPLPPADACELIRQAALALQHAHERNLIHRDIKPGNLMLAAMPDGPPLVKVLDFGLAQLVQSENTAGDLTISGELLGTVDYIAPEQIENPRTVDARADVYGLGATLYRLLSGQAPHQASDSTSTLYAKLLRITHQACPSIATLRPELAPGLIAVVDRMVARDPAQRYATASEAAAALAPFAETSNLAALLARVPRSEPQSFQEHRVPSPRPSSRRKARRCAIALVLLAVVGTLAFLIARKSSPAPTGVVRWPLEVPRWPTLGADGAIYGGCWWGGEFNHGGIYKFIAPTSIVTLVSFTGTNGPAKGHGAGLQLLQARDGAFYGVTEEGGRFDRGTVFRFDPTNAAASFTTLVEFNGTNGAQPRAGLIEDKNSPGTFYGATLDGGDRNYGTIFRIIYDGVSARHETLVHLTGDTGTAPGRTLHCALVQTADGTLYGTTHDGGRTGVGTVFKLTTDGRFTSLASFGQPPLLCYNPHAGLTLGLDGNLYGHCRYENKGFGAAFRLTPAGEVQVIARFGPPHGSYPASTLFRAPDGSFYGTTFRGGPSDQGTVFKLTPAGGLTTLAAFVGIGPASDPDAWATPILAADGNLYGTTERGGTARRGTIYRVTPTGELTTLVEFFKADKKK